jgi:hypothetical protein
MDAEETNRRLAEAESNVARALLRLQQVRRAILEGEFDPQVYDQALHAYHQAEYEAYDARRAWAQARTALPARPAPPDEASAGGVAPDAPDAPDGPDGPDGPDAPDASAPPGPPGTEPEPAPAPFRPTDRMRFVRWLVKHGRLSEWDVDDR